jgi:hypothetical protein
LIHTAESVLVFFYDTPNSLSKLIGTGCILIPNTILSTAALNYSYVISPPLILLHLCLLHIMHMLRKKVNRKIMPVDSSNIVLPSRHTPEKQYKDPPLLKTTWVVKALCIFTNPPSGHQEAVNSTASFGWSSHGNGHSTAIKEINSWSSKKFQKWGKWGFLSETLKTFFLGWRQS